MIKLKSIVITVKIRLFSFIYYYSSFFALEYFTVCKPRLPNQNWKMFLDGNPIVSAPNFIYVGDKTVKNHLPKVIFNAEQRIALFELTYSKWKSLFTKVDLFYSIDSEAGNLNFRTPEEFRPSLRRLNRKQRNELFERGSK